MMCPGFEKIVEERIQQAIRNGEFDRLEGAGKPLKLEDFSRIPEELRMAYKILKNADCLPPEVELKKEIITTEALLENMTDVQLRYKTIKKLNFLIMKLNSARNGSVVFEVPQKYEARLVERVSSNRSAGKP